MCSVWLLFSYPMLYSTSCLEYFNAFGKHILMHVLNSNLLQMHDVEHVYLLCFILYVMFSRACVVLYMFLSYGRLPCVYLISLCSLRAFRLMILFMAPILY